MCTGNDLILAKNYYETQGPFKGQYTITPNRATRVDGTHCDINYTYNAVYGPATGIDYRRFAYSDGCNKTITAMGDYNSGGSGSVTVNGYTFDATGYSVGKGWMWSPDSNIESSYMTSDTDCKNKCVSTALCDHWSRNTVSGKCTLTKNTNNESAHERGISSTDVSGGNIQELNNFNNQQIYTKPNDCISLCNADTACKGWCHRNSTHNDPKWRNTCVLYKFDKSNSNEQYVEGFVLR
jgi:hypothetical protein